MAAIEKGMRVIEGDGGLSGERESLNTVEDGIG